MEIWEGTEQGQDGEATRRMIKVCGMALCDSRSAALEPVGGNRSKEAEDTPRKRITEGVDRGDRGGGVGLVLAKKVVMVEARGYPMRNHPVVCTACTACTKRNFSMPVKSGHHFHLGVCHTDSQRYDCTKTRTRPSPIRRDATQNCIPSLTAVGTWDGGDTLEIALHVSRVLMHPLALRDSFFSLQIIAENRAEVQV